MIYRKYIETRKGTAPIIISSPHGGYLKPKKIPDKLSGFKKADKNKYQIAKKLIRRLENNNVKVYYILSKIHRSKVDFNRPSRSGDAFHQSSRRAKKIHKYYHKKLLKFYKKSISSFGKCIVIDLHGFTKPNENYPDIILGHIFGKTLKIFKDDNQNNSVVYWGFSNIIQEISKEFTFDDGLGLNNLNLAYSGGYITHRFYKKQNVNAIQIEVAKKIRVNSDLSDKYVKALYTALLNTLKDEK
ncbi:MAG: N-formylglutamate amidohydrolase [Candidatus Hermodarchaeota archaeon]